MPPRNARKALTPLMISVLLCIATAVSLATAAWINGLPTSNMYTEDLQAINHQWGPNHAYVDVTICNNGTQSVRLKSVTVNSQPATVVYIAGSNQINKGESAVLRVANTFVPGATYKIAFQTVKGNRFVYAATA
jgi:archaellum component FlaF (FlaF/FlaG flagellin family)